MKEYIVITGASSGIGQALSIEFANMGYNVLAIGRNEVGLQRTKKSASNGTITPLIADLNKEESLDYILKQFNSETIIKYLVHCAAVIEPLSSLLQADQHDLTVSIATNVISPLSLTSKLKHYFTSATRVLFLGSDYVGVDNKIKPHVSGAYSISKTALKVAVEYLRRECNDIALIGYLNPGTTQTPIYTSFWKAVNTQGATNTATTPASPASVAHFIYNVLENSDNKTFCTIDWDYRKSIHHDQIMKPEKVSVLRARL